DKVARVVFDLKSPRPYEIHPSPTGLVVDFSEAVALRKNSPPTSVEPRPLLAAGETPAPTAEAPAAASAEPAAKTVGTPSQPPTEGEPAPLGTNLAAESAKPTPEAGLTPVTLPAEPEAAGEKSSTDTSSETEKSPAPDKIPMRPAKTSVARNAVENTISAPSSRYGARTISDSGEKYTGKRISLNFKDADLKDVFRIFHEIS